MAAFDTQNTTLNAFDNSKGSLPVSVGRGVRTENIQKSTNSLQVSVTENTWSRACACFEWDKNYKKNMIWDTSVMMDTSWRNTFLMSTSSQVWKWSVMCFFFFFFTFLNLPLSLLQQNKLKTLKTRRLTQSELFKKWKQDQTNKYIHHWQ